MLTFSRNLNLTVEDDLLTFFQEGRSAGYPILVSNEDELKNLIHFGREFLPDSAFEISGGLTPIHVRPKWAIAYNFLEDILPIIYFLHLFRSDNSFMVKVKANLANLYQFDDTLFELKCLKRFYGNGFSFQYEPEVISGGKRKKPDFRLTKEGIELFCECKQVRIGKNKAELQFINQCDYVRGKFPKDFEKQLFKVKLRLEVNFKRNPSPANLDELARHLGGLYSSVQGLHELPMQQIGDSLEYLVVPQSEPSQFPMRAMRSGSILIGSDEPRRIFNPVTGSPEGEVIFTSTDLARRRRETLIRLIREAKNQLPDDKFGIIIIGRTNIMMAKEEIEKRMNGRHYNNIIAFVVNPFEDFWSCYRTNYRELLSNLFEGFQPKNPFCQTELQN